MLLKDEDPAAARRWYEQAAARRRGRQLRAMAALPNRSIAPECSAQKLLGVTPRTPSQWLADIDL